MARFFSRHFNFLSEKKDLSELEAICDTFGERAAFKKLALYIATSYIANALSGCEIKVIRDGKEQKDLLYYRLNVAPNPNMSGAQFVDDVVTRLCLESECLVVNHRDNFYPAQGFSYELRPLKDTLYRGVVVEEQQMQKTYKASDCYFFKLEDRKVRALINSLYDDYSKLLSAAIEGFRQSHGRKFKLILDNVKVGDESFAENYENVVKKQLKEFIESDTAVYPQYAGYDLQEMKQEAAGGADDILAMRKEVFDLVAQAYKIPVSMMYGNTNNTKEVLNQFLTFSVDPIAKMMSDELTRKSFTFDEWQAGCRVVVDTKSINHTDIFDVADRIDKLISSGVFSVDDVLTTLGFSPLSTDFSRAHYVTKNYAPADEALNNVSGGGEQ